MRKAGTTEQHVHVLGVGYRVQHDPLRLRRAARGWGRPPIPILVIPIIISARGLRWRWGWRDRGLPMLPRGGLAFAFRRLGDSGPGSRKRLQRLRERRRIVGGAAALEHDPLGPVRLPDVGEYVQHVTRRDYLYHT